MDQPLILALDIGTSSVRAALYDATANPIPRASVKIERTLTLTADGGAEIDADDAFDQAAATIDAVLEKTKRLKGEIAHVASCSFWHSLVGVDASDRPTTKVFGWADTRSRKYTEVLRKRFDETETHNRTGACFHSSFWPAKLLWLEKENPGVFAKTGLWLSFSDYAAKTLFGEAATSISMASGTGIFDIRRSGWDAQLIKFLKIKPAMLPTVVAEDHTFSLNKKFAKRWPRLAAAKWFPTIADGAADNIGSGCATRSRAALMVGTSGAMRVAYTGEPPAKIPAGLWCYRIDRQRVIIGGALSDGGGLYQWLKKNFRLPRDAEAQIASGSADSHGLTFLPFLAGERSTGYHESALGSIMGMTSATTSVDILQAAFESVAYRFAEIFDQLNSVVKVNEIVASGGALRGSPVWTQIIADVLGRDLLLNDAAESSSRGAVLLALESIGKIKDIDVLSAPIAAKTAFHPKCHAVYKGARQRHQKYYESIVSTK